MVPPPVHDRTSGSVIWNESRKEKMSLILKCQAITFVVLQYYVSVQFQSVLTATDARRLPLPSAPLFLIKDVHVYKVEGNACNLLACPLPVAGSGNRIAGRYAA